MKRKITIGSLRDNLLVFLATSGPISKKALHTPFKSMYSTQYYSRAYRRLLEYGYIQETKVNGRLEVRLTREGIAAVRALHPDREITKAPAAKDYMKKRRQQMQAGTRAVFAGAGIIVSGAAKPDLEELQKQNSEEETRYNRSITRGIFYSSSELKQICKIKNGSSEYLYSSRLLGIVLYEQNIFYIYNIGQKLIELYPKRELKTITAIQKALNNIPVIKNSVNIEESGTCILLGNLKSMLVKVYKGNTYGKTVTAMTKGKMSQMQRWQTVHATYDTFRLLFDKIYFASCDTHGADILKTIKELYANDLTGTSNALCQKVAKQAHAVIDGSCGNMGFIPKTGENIVPMPIIEMVEMDTYIRELKSRDTTATVYGQKYYADVISRCFGKAIAKYVSLEDMEEVPIFFYDNDGYPDGDTYMSGLIPVANSSR